MPLHAVARSLIQREVHPGRCPICGPTLFCVRGPWLRDEYLCVRCQSIPRQRAFVQVLKEVMPDFASRRVFESSPGGASSDWVAARCRHYTASQLFEDIPRGQRDPAGVVSEDLQDLTLADASVDLVITQDVFEHVLEPERALAEITRVLAPGGLHLWTVPIFAGRATVRRVEPDGYGGVRHLLAPDYHGNPLGGGSLVIHEWGEDLLELVDRVSGLHTTRHVPRSRWNGIDGEMLDVLVSRKAPAA